MAKAGNVGKWRKHKFRVNSKLIRSFDDLQIKGSHETETKTKDGQKVETKKKTKATEVSLTVLLSALTGCNVRKEALKFVSEARTGKKGYFYVGGKKLVKYKLILTDATVKEVQIAHNNKWVSAEVALTMKQTKKGKGSGSSGNSSSSGSGSGTGSSKASVRTSTPVSSGGSGSYSGSFGSSGSGTKAVADASEVDAISSAAPTAAKVKVGNSLIASSTSRAGKILTQTSKPIVTKPLVTVNKTTNVRMVQ